VIPEVTALIPTFERPKLLRRAITSVLNQSYGNVKVKIFDDASNDETQDVVVKMQQGDKRIIYHRLEENIGLKKNYRLAFTTKVDSPYFSILSDDDFLLPNFYEEAVKVLEENKEIDFVIMGTLAIDENKNLIRDLDNSNNLIMYNDDNRLDNFISSKADDDFLLSNFYEEAAKVLEDKNWASMLFRREVAHAYLDMDVQNIDVGHDMRFLLRAITRHKFACLPLPAACALYWDDNNAAKLFKPVDYLHQAVQISRFLEIYGDQNVPEKIKEKMPAIIENFFHQNIFTKSLRRTLFLIFRNHVLNQEKDRRYIRETINFYKKRGFKKTAVVLKFCLNNKLIQVFIYYLLGPIAKKALNRRKAKMADIKKKKFSKEFHAIEKIMRDPEYTHKEKK